MNPSQNERGAALQVVLLLTLVISLGLIALLSTTLAQLRFLEDGRRLLQLSYHAESGIVELLSAIEHGYKAPEATGRLSWRLAYGDTCTVSGEPWGAFYRLSAGAQAGRQSALRIAVAGYPTGERFDAALWIKPVQYALVVCGNTRLYGDVFAGPAGVRKERFRGRAYSGEKPVFGNIYRSSEDRRHELNREMIREIYQRQHELLQQPATATLQQWSRRASAATGLPEEPVLQLLQEELDLPQGNIKGPVTLLAGGDIVLRSGWTFHNFVRILAGGRIHIEPGVQLQNSLCFSPESISLQGVQAENLQLIAGKNISIGGSSTVAGNSVLLCSNRIGKTDIALRDEVRFAGTVCLDAPDAAYGADAGKLLIGESSIVRGVVYAYPLLELRGRVYGSVTCGGFHFYHSPTHYYNWIYDGIIDRRAAELRFVPLFFYQPDSLLTIMEYIR